MNSEFIKQPHHLWERYRDDWTLQFNSFVGGTEYKNGKYLRAYSSDTNSPSETINTYVVDDFGAVTSKVRAKIDHSVTRSESSTGEDQIADGTFYGEKLENTPLYNYVKLIVSEYNSILFRNPPQRVIPITDVIDEFINNVDGEGNNINEFCAQLDQYTTIFGVCHIGVYLHDGMPRWKLHTPLEITNWKYKTNSRGEKVLDQVVICLDETEDYKVYRYMSADTIKTVWVGEDQDWEPTEPLPGMVDDGEGVWYTSEPNELGYVPIVTTYQSIPVYSNIGTTVISDCSMIQRSIYGDLAEIYSAITYNAHPTLVVDESTDELNNGEIGAEPGGVVRVQNSLNGEPNYVFEFVAPPLDAITEIRELIDNKIVKMAQVAMLRSESLVKASRSGEQIEQYDDKLAAQIRRKATNMENSEYNAWKITFDWLNLATPDDFSISYNRQYNKRAVEHEVTELRMILDLITESGNTLTLTGEIQSELSNRILELVKSTSTSNGV